MLEIKNLSFSYHNKEFLKDINLRLERGDFLGILGPNGSGKSTLLKNMLKNLDYKKGEIVVLGKKLKDYELKEFAKISGFMPQHSQLHTALKVIDVLLMGKFVSLKHSFLDYSKQDIDEAKQMAKILKLESFLDRNVLSLSGGEFQRVMLGRALLKKPKILFLDEPTSALDLNYAIELLNLCEDMINTNNISVIAILHDLNLASLFCNKIIFLKDGKIAYSGEVKELFKKEILKEIYDLNCDISYHNDKPYIILTKEKK
ncbi:MULTISPECIES: ABC transporter ATP-binding protein [unclassified Campylobacter]|uniref:ABC transporter ATP-binding protein n=1 Tax=unclassified Campylobacter TaxID=2593542 RepID=UPI001237BB60|nr:MULTISPECIES: ABC transporter ATP-binding protein [unclassified Campylobacter]KAA6224979.1 ABC transporter ATP-binding protein [Campylobacter sp. LR196d]KAA6225301.1 ABC transporter ATP-binding protein [Campylobacter sp. LR286c]KAA6225580.1 ABC transporter ATP-binding protein [Campylobacter sp. LR185c]KAA6230426.1 ABC transporter ATP-binding protein [Campylobacter sp. LR291e]KAA6230548.1 ABC transporter ATP-binding protein [Campylobacter sp. LR264d]